MAELTTIARPYAKAAFEFALEKGELEAWSEALSFAAAVVQDDTMSAYLELPNLTSAQLTETFVSVCEGRLNEACKNFVSQLAQNKRLTLLPVIAGLYEQHLAEHQNTLEVIVASAYELTEAEASRLKGTLKQKFGQEVSLEAQVDQSLIGGVVIRAGDMVIDHSVKGKLTRLSQQVNS